MKKILQKFLIVSLFLVAAIIGTNSTVFASNVTDKKRTSSVGWETLGWVLTSNPIDTSTYQLPAASGKDIIQETVSNTGCTDYNDSKSRKGVARGGKIQLDDDMELQYVKGDAGTSSNGYYQISEHKIELWNTVEKVRKSLFNYPDLNSPDAHKESKAHEWDITTLGLSDEDIEDMVNGKVEWRTFGSNKEYTIVWAQSIIGVYRGASGGTVTYDRDSKGYIKEYRSLQAWKNAAGWANTSTFKYHYNVPIKIVRGVPNVRIRFLTSAYETFSNGDVYKKNQKLGKDGKDNVKAPNGNILVKSKNTGKTEQKLTKLNVSAGDVIEIEDLGVRDNYVTYNGHTFVITGIEIIYDNKKQAADVSRGSTLVKNDSKTMEKYKEGAANIWHYKEGKRYGYKSESLTNRLTRATITLKAQFYYRYNEQKKRWECPMNTFYDRFKANSIKLGSGGVLVNYYVTPVSDDAPQNFNLQFKEEWYNNGGIVKSEGPTDAKNYSVDADEYNKTQVLKGTNANKKAKQLELLTQYWDLDGIVVGTTSNIRNGQPVSSANCRYGVYSVTATNNAKPATVNGVRVQEWDGASSLNNIPYVPETDIRYQNYQSTYYAKVSQLTLLDPQPANSTVQVTKRNACYAPSIVLKYYEDSKGNLSLFSIENTNAESGKGNAYQLNSADEFNVNSSYGGGTGLQYSAAGTEIKSCASGYITGPTSFNSTEYKDMVLYRAGVYDLTDEVSNIAGLFEGTTNAFSDHSLPSGAYYSAGDGSKESYTYGADTDYAPGSGNTVMGGCFYTDDDMDNAMKAALTGATPNTITLSAKQNYCPMAFVYVYHEQPHLYVKTFITDSTTRGSDDVFKVITKYYADISSVGSTINYTKGDEEKVYDNVRSSQYIANMQESALKVNIPIKKNIYNSSLLALDRAFVDYESSENLRNYFPDAADTQAKLKKACLSSYETLTDAKPILDKTSFTRAELYEYVSAIDSDTLDYNGKSDLGNLTVLIKVVEPDPISYYWQTEYYDVEDGARDVSNPYTNYKNNYVRFTDPIVSRSQTIKEFFKGESPIEGEFQYQGNTYKRQDCLYADFGMSKVIATTNVDNITALQGEYDLVNIGVSTKAMSEAEVNAAIANGTLSQNVLQNFSTKAYENGFTGDVVDNKVTNTNAYASANYAKKVLSNLEKSDEIMWMRDPYDAAHFSCAPVTNQEILHFYGYDIPDTYDSKIASGELKNQSASAAKFILSSAQSGGSHVWVWGIYKSRKAISSAILLKNDDGTYSPAIGTDLQYTGDWKTQNLNTYTTEFTLYFPEYLESNGKTYKRNVVYNRWGNDGFVGFTPTDIKDIAKIQDWGDITADETMDDANIALENEHSYKPGREITVGDGPFNFDFSTGAFTTRVKGQYNYVVATYEPYEPKCKEWKYETVEEKIQWHTTEGGVHATSSREGLDTAIWENGLSQVTTDSDYATVDKAGKGYVASSAIPTSEYLRTDSQVPEYLVDMDIRKITTTAYCYLLFYNISGYNYTYTDVYGNVCEVYASHMNTYDTCKTKSITYYALEGSTVFIPNDATVYNYALPENLGDAQIAETVTETLDDISKIFEDTEGPRIEVTQAATISLPSLEHGNIKTVLYMGYASMKYKNRTQAVQGDDDKVSIEVFEEARIHSLVSSSYQVADQYMPDMRARNDAIVFHNGHNEDFWILSETEGLTNFPAEPEMITPAKLTDAGVFSSKNENRMYYTRELINGKPSYDPISYQLSDFMVGDTTQGDTTKLQIEKWKKNGAEISKSAVHYILWDRDGIGTNFNADGSLNSEFGAAISETTVENTKKVWNEGLVFGLSVNGVNILTPAYIETTLESMEAWNQEINKGVGETLILDKPFKLTINTTGTFSNDLSGYGERDYTQYLAKSTSTTYAEIDGVTDGTTSSGTPYEIIPAVQIRFPFEVVYAAKNSAGEWVYKDIAANTWFAIKSGEQNFLLPSWVEEKDTYVVRTRAITQNAYQNDWEELGRDGVTYDTDGNKILGTSESLYSTIDPNTFNVVESDKPVYKAEVYDRTENLRNLNANAIQSVEAMSSNTGGKTTKEVNNAFSAYEEAERLYKEKYDALIEQYLNGRTFDTVSDDECVKILDKAEEEVEKLADNGGLVSTSEDFNGATYKELMEIYEGVVHARDFAQEQLDKIPWNYVATSNVITNVVGRIYGFEIIDVGDYPTWEDNFRDKDGNLMFTKTKGQEDLAGAYKSTDKTSLLDDKTLVVDMGSYSAGTLDRNSFANGVSLDRTVPLIDGKYGITNGQGYVKAGYPIRFKVQTIGNLAQSDDYVQVTPMFSWIENEGNVTVNEDGTSNITDALDVNVWYMEGDELTYVGSDLSKANSFTTHIGSDKFTVPYEQLEKTAALLGFKKTEDFSDRETHLYNYANVMMNQYVRTFNGLEHTTELMTTNGTATYKSLVDMLKASGVIDGDGDGVVSSATVDKSVQTWYGEWMLPSDIHVTTYDEETVRRSVKGSKPTWKEKVVDSEGNVTDADLWQQSGFLVVNFFMNTIDGGEYHLSYDVDIADFLEHEKLQEQLYETAKEILGDDATQEAIDEWVATNEMQLDRISGDCNMWRTEGFERNQISGDGVNFFFNYGDVLVYDFRESSGKGDGSSSSATDDYKSGGTH